MNRPIPKELTMLYGNVAISRIATAKTNARLKEMPDVAKALEKFRSGKEVPKGKSLHPFDVENGGMSDEFEDFMTAGFEELVPDWVWGDIGSAPKKPPAIKIPDRVRNCARILAALRDAVEEARVQQQVVEDLEALVAALRKNAHPLVQVFAALFKGGLEDAQNRLREVNLNISWLVSLARSEDCEIPATL